ncbi:hypothetical protein Golax_002592, partial [Gossypium laxum]|nr:hypothetical protein [Gossypium laxum]
MPGLQACVAASDQGWCTNTTVFLGASTLRLVETRKGREHLFSKCGVLVLVFLLVLSSMLVWNFCPSFD